MKPRTREMIEGPEASERFNAGMRTILGVSHDELKRRMEAYKKKAALNPRKRGPKPKRKPVSHGPAV